jgi:release factor glutamine methyltransferase
MDAGVSADESRRDAALLARAVLGWDAAAWIARQHETAPDDFPRVFDRWIDRRRRREPVAYIIGEREFYGRPFHVTPAVLIPRPETELLVEEAIAALGELVADGRFASPIVVDVGTGSGCIAVTLALEQPSARVIATEVSMDALAVARDNADRLGAAGRVEFRAGSLLASLSATPDVIVSNPPYVGEADRWSLPPEVRDFEPDLALSAGLDGLDVIRPLVAAAGRALAPGGRLLIEIGAGQAAAVTRLVAETPGLALSRIRLDLQGIPRIVVARRE